MKACEGATVITNYEKKEGQGSRVFIFNTDNGKRVVAKLPFRIGRPNGLIVESELATVHFGKCRESLSLGVGATS